jgi:hypothetical protein
MRVNSVAYSHLSVGLVLAGTTYPSRVYSHLSVGLVLAGITYPSNLLTFVSRVSVGRNYSRKSTLLLHTKSQEEHITTTHQKPGRAHYSYTLKARKSTCSSNVLFLAFSV